MRILHLVDEPYDSGLTSYALAAANEYGVPMPTLAAARELYQMAKGLGFGEQDFAAVAEGLRQVSDQTERT